MKPAAGDRANKKRMNVAELLGEAILSTHSDAIVATDRDGIIRFWNPGAERVFGHSRQEAVGYSLDLIIPERLRQRHWEGFANAMRSGQSRYGEGDLLSVPALRNDGTTLSVQFTIAPLRESGQMVGMAAIIRDVTKQFNETRELKRALSDLKVAAGDVLARRAERKRGGWAGDMDRTQQKERATSFLARHHGSPVLLLPNVWDAMSARLFVEAGFDALATTSGGIAWALGYPDGESAPWPEVVAATARIVRCVSVPVTADIEAGYGETPAAVGAHVAEIIQAGAVGVNLEDGVHGALRNTEDMVARLQAARQAAITEGVPIVVNARCDVFHLQPGAESERLAVTIDRCNAYLAAGADCVYPFGLRDPETIAALVKAVGGPVNVTGRPGMPDAAALERLGVARITIASAPTLVVMDAIQKLASEFRVTGSFDILSAKLHRPDVQRLFQPKG